MVDQDERKGGTGVGALLRASRERCGEDLGDVAKMLRIRRCFVEAIEDSRFDDLPGATYAVGFIRAYAEHLGLDSAEVVRRFKAETSGIGGAPELLFPSPITESSVPGGAIMLVGALLAVLAYGGWYVSTSNQRFFVELIPSLPDRLATLLGNGEGEPAPSPAVVATAAPPAGTADDTLERSSEAAPREIAAEEETAELAEESALSTPAASVSPDTASPPATEPQAVELVSPPPPGAAEAAAGDGGEGKVSETTTATAEPEVTEAEPATVESPVAEETVAEETGTETTTAHAEPEVAVAEPEVAVAEPTTAVPEATVVSAAAGPETTVVSAAAAQEEETTIPPAPVPGGDDTAMAEGTGEAATAERAEAAAEEPRADDEAVLSDADSKVPAGAGGDDRDSAERQVAAVPVASAATGLAGGARNLGAGGEGSRIVVRAKMDSWIQVRDDLRNRLLVTRLLRTGDSYRVPDRPGLKLLTGNAGALEILVDGQAVPSIGPLGVVRRGVALDAERLREGKAAPE